MTPKQYEKFKRIKDKLLSHQDPDKKFLMDMAEEYAGSRVTIEAAFHQTETALKTAQMCQETYDIYKKQRDHARARASKFEAALKEILVGKIQQDNECLLGPDSSMAGRFIRIARQAILDAREEPIEWDIY